MTRFNALAATSVLCLVAGCGEFTPVGVTPEEAELVADFAREGNVAELQKLLAEKPALANVQVREGTSLLEIVVDCRPTYPNMHATVKVLLENGADPNFEAPEILRKAIWRGEPEIVELLLEHGADPTVVSAKKNVNMIEYAKSTGDARFDPIIDAWEAGKRT